MDWLNSTHSNKVHEEVMEVVVAMAEVMAEVVADMEEAAGAITNGNRKTAIKEEVMAVVVVIAEEEEAKANIKSSTQTIMAIVEAITPGLTIITEEEVQGVMGYLMKSLLVMNLETNASFK